MSLHVIIPWTMVLKEKYFTVKSKNVGVFLLWDSIIVYNAHVKVKLFNSNPIAEAEWDFKKDIFPNTKIKKRAIFRVFNLPRNLT